MLLQRPRKQQSLSQIPNLSSLRPTLLPEEQKHRRAHILSVLVTAGARNLAAWKRAAALAMIGVGFRFGWWFLFYIHQTLSATPVRTLGTELGSARVWREDSFGRESFAQPLLD